MKADSPEKTIDTTCLNELNDLSDLKKNKVKKDTKDIKSVDDIGVFMEENDDR